MSASESDRNVKFLDRKLDKTQLEFMKIVELQNLDRVLRLKKIRRNNVVVGCTLGVSVLGIYLYSMLSVKQEKFLDDFEEPKKIQMAGYGVVAGSGIRLPPLPTIRDLVKIYNLQAMKQLSQNFLMDERLTDKIVKAAGKIAPTDVVLEVGPGPGGITRSLLRRQPAKLILVEKDRRFLPTLELLKECIEPLGATTVDIYQADILRFSMIQAIPPEFSRIHLIGNLPFAISTRLLINWLEDLSLRRGAFRGSVETTMTLTFQQEVAERIIAPLGNSQRCRLSVMSQIWTEPVLKFSISGKAFVPKPDVDVGVVKLVPLRHPKTDLPFKLVEKVCRHTFNMRQKYCRRGYGTLFPEANRDDIVHEMFQEADVDPMARPFQLSVEEYLRLARAYHNFIEKNPEIALYDYRAQKVKRSEYDVGDSVACV